MSRIWVGLTRRLRLVDVEPLDPVDLGNVHAAQARRPDHLERVAVRRRRVEVALEAQAWTTLPPFWTMLPQLDRVAVRRAVAGLLLELAPGDRDRAPRRPSASPLRIVQWPASRFVKNGPPG